MKISVMFFYILNVDNFEGKCIRMQANHGSTTLSKKKKKKHISYEEYTFSKIRQNVHTKNTKNKTASTVWKKQLSLYLQRPKQTYINLLFFQAGIFLLLLLIVRLLQLCSACSLSTDDSSPQPSTLHIHPLHTTHKFHLLSAPRPYPILITFFSKSKH